MTRSLTTLFALAALGTLGACAADNGDEGLFVSRVLAPTADCTFTIDAMSAFISHGNYQLGTDVFGDYHPTVQVESRITATATATAQRTVQLRGARVHLTNPDGSEISGASSDLVKFRSLTSGPVEPNDGVTNVDFDLVPYKLSQLLYPQRDERGFYDILATFSLYGDMNGSEVGSQDFVFPITLSDGVGAQNKGTCPLPMGTVVRTSGNGCSLYSEGITDCCTQGTDLICPAVVATTTP
ncbi:MAG TPA: hypothetical protein VGM90_38115 [Kofleriaceae bacterium]|jgi:hypothetical protein